MRYLTIIILLFATQSIFWYGIPSVGEGAPIWAGTRSIKPDLGIVPPVPSHAAMKLMALGDDELMFRLATYRLQNAGDTFGRSTPLYKYNFAKLSAWWDLLDGMNDKSNYNPTLASYYFGATQKPKEQLPYVVDYLERHADKDPSKKWWWYTQVVYLAKQKMEDNARAMIAADKLLKIPREVDMPIWARQMGVFILENEGDMDKACRLIVQIFQEQRDRITPEEAYFIHYFITERLAGKSGKDIEIKEEVRPECRDLFIELYDRFKSAES